MCVFLAPLVKLLVAAVLLGSCLALPSQTASSNQAKRAQICRRCMQRQVNAVSRAILVHISPFYASSDAAFYRDYLTNASLAPYASSANVTPFPSTPHSSSRKKQDSVEQRQCGRCTTRPSKALLLNVL
jgi:hypothetical protein